MKVIIYILIIASVLIAPVFALADCNQPGTTVVFINGMFTPTESQANDAKIALQHQYDLKGKNSNVTFLLGYNQSHILQTGDIFDAVTQAYNGGYVDYDLTTILRQIHGEINTQKILLVGHSQGTFYTNAAYDYLTSHGVDKNSIAVYNVGTPADVVAGNGKYLTSSTDKLISSVVAKLTALFFAKKPLPPNITLPLSATEQADPLGGHSFDNVYLAEAPDRIVSDMDSELSALQATNPAGSECFVEPPANTTYIIEDFGYKAVDGALAYLGANETPTSPFQSPQDLLAFGNSIFSGAYNAGADLIGSVYSFGAGLLGDTSSSGSSVSSGTASSSSNTGSGSAQSPAGSTSSQDSLDNLVEQLDALSPAALTQGVVIPPIQASCSAVPNPGTTNQQITFAATATGGLSSTYSYSWAGDCVLSPSSPANANCLKTFTTAGNYAATVTVTPWPPGLVLISGTATCPVTVNAPTPYFNLAVCYLGATGTQATQAKYGYLGRDLNPGNVSRNTVTNNGIVPQDVPVGSSTARVWSSNTYQMNANNYVWTVTIDGTTKTSTIDTLNGHTPSFYDTMRCPAVCGDGICTGAETCITCSVDCGGCGGGGGDTTPPVITLLGSPTVNVTVGGSYTDAGATAFDNVDGDITSKIVTVNPVNTLVPGIYIVTYNVSDAAGNAAAQVTRTVNVWPSLQASCYSSPNPASAGQQITFGSTISGGTGVYTFSWTGGCTGTGANCQTSFPSAGTYTANLSATSGTQTVPATCPVVVNPAKILITEVQIQGADAYQDFIELYNPNSTDVYLDNYRLVKRAETSSQDTTVKSWAGDAVSKIPAQSYYLWASSTDAGYPASINADVSTQQNISPHNGIAIRYGPNDTGQIIDAVGWGTFDNVLYEASAFPADPGQDQSLGRKFDGTNYQDTDNNPNDFELGTPTPGNPNAGDTTPPVITFLGSSEVTVTLGHDYVDAGATAFDNVDGDITSKIVTVNPVDKNTIDDYVVTYNVTDSSGNQAIQVIRIVHVVPPFDIFCSALPSSGDPKENITFRSQVPEGMDNCTYLWTGDCTGSQSNCVKAFDYGGDYTATLDAACSGQFSTEVSCSTSISGNPPPVINSADNPADITVPFGTLLANLPLPSTVTANLSDSTMRDLPVSWATAGYDGNNAQTYTFTGTFNTPLPDGITNPSNVTASVNVTVLPYMPHLLITEIQTAGATDPKDEFIEIYNPASSAVDLTGYYLTKETSSGNESDLVSHLKFSGSIAASGYFLIVPWGNCNGSPTYTGSATPDLCYSSSGYSIASDNTILLYDSKHNLVDKVGYGNAADYETAPTVNPPAAESIGRIFNFDTSKYQDTDNNLNDFELQQTPSPRQAPPTPPAPLSAFCSAQPSDALLNQNVAFVSQVSGGIGTYTYSWTGGCNASTANCQTNFPTAGTYTANLSVTSGVQNAGYSCQVNVTPPIPQVTAKDITGCSNPDICTQPNYGSDCSNGPCTGASAVNGSAGISYFLPRISWQSSDSDIVSYHVQYRRNNEAWQDWPGLAPTDTSAMFGNNMVPKALYDMLNDEIYSFRVSAKNSQGAESLWQEVDVDLRNPVVINEVAPFGTGGSVTNGWIELYNKSDSAVDLTGWKIRGGTGFPDSLVIKLSGSIPSKSYLVLQKPAGAINTSGYLYLVNKFSRQIDNFYYPLDGWQQSDFQKNGQFYSMERISPYGVGANRSNWMLSTSADYGTPGSVNTDYQLYTPISTDFAENTDLPPFQGGVNSPYLFQGFVTVYENKTLTIEPGTIIKFINSDSITPSGMMVWGALQANGSSSPIVFTSIHDDQYGGDIDQDGGATAPQPGNWNGIKFGPSGSGSQMNNVIVRYAGDIWNSDFGAGIKVDTTSISLANSTIEKNENNGLYLVNSASTVDSTKILENNLPASPFTAGVSVDVSSVSGGSPTISNSDFENNYYGIFASIFSGGNNPTIQNCTFGNNSQDAEPASLLGP